MRKVSLIVFLSFSLAIHVMGQVLNRAEYFFDSDPGTGNGIPVTITAASSINMNFNANVSTLAQGFHTLAFRTHDSNGNWSHFQSRSFFIFTAPASSSTITRQEYFFDVDPGLGNGTGVALSAAPATDQNLAISINALTTGFHTFNYRVRDLQGRWSLFACRTFFIIPPITGSTAVNVTRAEYFFDLDPGAGAGTNIPVSAGASISANVAAPITSLTTGFHSINVRVKDDKGTWSHFANRTFYIINPAHGTPASTLTKAEYFFDTDPGAGNAIPLTVVAGNPQSSSYALNISSLSPGFHTLSIRYRDNLGRWSLFSPRTFYIIPTNSLSASTVKNIEYYVDTDPGIGLANNVPVTAAPLIDQTFALDMSGVGSGPHKLNIRAKDDKGFWSVAMSADFTVLACTPPPAPTSAGGSRCNTGTVILTAAGASGTQVYRWYADPTTSTVLFTGPSFTTPSLTASSTFYAAVFDPATLCESLRTAVIASVVTTNPPVLNVTGNLTICEGNSVTLIAPGGFSNYSWSTGATAQQIVVNTAGSYTAIVGNGTCQSLPSLPAIITLATRPGKPSITSTGSLCTASTMTLQGPPSFASYIWSNGATTQSAVINQPGSYSLVVGDVNGCTSLPSDPTIIEGPPLKPSIFVVGNSTICIGETVTLVGPPGFDGYLWSSGATTQQLTTGIAGSYTLQVTDAQGCVSPASDPVQVNVNTGCTSSHPPLVQAKVVTVAVQGTSTESLADWFSDPDDDLDLTSLTIITPLPSGAGATLDSDGKLTLDYTNTLFSGQESLTLEICDIAHNCTRENVVINVVGEVVVYNAVSPNGDGLNEFLFLEYIDLLEEAKNNRVRIFNRWGDVVYDATNYNNNTIAFKGTGTTGDVLPTGTYFYRIDFTSGIPYRTGFISLRK